MLVPIMFTKSPITVWSNAPKFCLLCSKYAPYTYGNHYTPQIQHFFSLTLPSYITKLRVSLILLALLQYEIPSIYLTIISMNININTSSSVVLYCQLWSIHS